MDAVATHFMSEVGPVIENERDIGALRDRHQNFDGVPNRIVAYVFQPQLQRRDIACAEGAIQRFGEALGLELRRRDEIKPAAFRHAVSSFDKLRMSLKAQSSC
jgi:hypothetical protein